MQVLPADVKPPSAADLARIQAEIRKALDDCRAGKPDAIARLRRLGAAHPRLVIDATGADLFTLATQALLKVTCGDKGPELAALKEGIVLRLEQLTADLSGPNPSAVKKLCARALAYDELSFWLLQLLATNAGDKASSGLIRRLNSCHRRMMSSLRTLSQIARLEAPRPRPVVAIQVNAQGAEAPAVDWPGEMPAFPDGE
jgi:hypothetical protein